MVLSYRVCFFAVLSLLSVQTSAGGGFFASTQQPKNTARRVARPGWRPPNSEMTSSDGTATANVLPEVMAKRISVVSGGLSRRRAWDAVNKATTVEICRKDDYKYAASNEKDSRNGRGGGCESSAACAVNASRKLAQVEVRKGGRLNAQSALARLGLKNTAVLVRGAGTGATVETGAGGGRQSGWANAAEGLKNGLASGLAAAVVKTVLQPFDTMKTVQQFSTARMSLLQAGRNLVARGGVQELYQGLGVTLIGSMPSVGVYFGLYQFAKRQLDARGDVSPYLSITVSAGFGNFIASFFRVPYEVVKQRLQVGAYPSTMVALQSIYRQGGLAGFFGKGGLKTQWARDIPYAMVTLLVYETLQNSAAKRRGPNAKKKGSPIENMVIGAVAGGMGSLVTNPMDMIKTRMMVSPELYASPMDAAWIALRTEGPQAFMKGATPRLMHKIPANAFFFVAYEFFRNLLGVTR